MGLPTWSTHNSPTPSLLLRVRACFHLLCKVSWRWRYRENLSWIPLKPATQLVEHLRGHGFESSWWYDFFPYFLFTPFYKQTFSSSFFDIQSRYRSRILAKLHALHLATLITLWQIDMWFCSFFTSMLKALVCTESWATFLLKPQT